MNRRGFFQKLASGLFVASAPTLFLPKLIKPQWKAPRNLVAVLDEGPDWDAVLEVLAIEKSFQKRHYRLRAYKKVFRDGPGSITYEITKL